MKGQPKRGQPRDLCGHIWSPQRLRGPFDSCLDESAVLQSKSVGSLAQMSSGSNGSTGLIAIRFVGEPTSCCILLSLSLMGSSRSGATCGSRCRQCMKWSFNPPIFQIQGRFQIQGVIIPCTPNRVDYFVLLYRQWASVWDSLGKSTPHQSRRSGEEW